MKKKKRRRGQKRDRHKLPLLAAKQMRVKAENQQDISRR
jgi:hypothetical protein